MTGRQTKAVAEAIAASIYHSEGLETMNYAGVEDYCTREWHHYEKQSQAAITASDAQYVPLLVAALRKIAGDTSRAMTIAREALDKLPDDYRN